MLQSLLIDRFGLTFHHHLKPLRVYELVIARKGTKLKMPSGNITATSAGKGHLEARDAPLSTLAEMLTPYVGRMVLDRTGLHGNFDYSLSWDPEEDNPAPSASEPSGESPDIDRNRERGSLLSALAEQLGLKLEAKTDPVDTIVVDHIGRPTGN